MGRGGSGLRLGNSTTSEASSVSSKPGPERLSGWKLLATWLAFGLGLGLLGALEIFVASGGDIGVSLTMVGVGLVIGLVVGTIYAVVYRNRPPAKRVPLTRQDWLLVGAVLLLSMAGRILRLSGAPEVAYVPLTGLAFIPLVALVRRRRERP